MRHYPRTFAIHISAAIAAFAVTTSPALSQTVEDALHEIQELMSARGFDTSDENFAQMQLVEDNVLCIDYLPVSGDIEGFIAFDPQSRAIATLGGFIYTDSSEGDYNVYGAADAIPDDVDFDTYYEAFEKRSQQHSTLLDKCLYPAE